MRIRFVFRKALQKVKFLYPFRYHLQISFLVSLFHFISGSPLPTALSATWTVVSGVLAMFSLALFLLCCESRLCYTIPCGLESKVFSPWLRLLPPLWDSLFGLIRTARVLQPFCDLSHLRTPLGSALRVRLSPVFYELGVIFFAIGLGPLIDFA